MRLLVVEDDPALARQLAERLEGEGYAVDRAADGEEGQFLGETEPYDAIVLDLGLPRVDGLTVLRSWRTGGITAPVIILTARGAWTEKVQGIDAGADDYLAKPFSPRELLARVKAVLRRASGPPVAGGAVGKTLGFEGWTLDLAKRELRSPDGVLVQLSAGEYDLLVAFVEHPQRVLTRDQLLDLARGRSAVPFDRSIDVQVSRLRRKIEPDPADPTMIKTVRGGGYLFTPAVTGG